MRRYAALAVCMYALLAAGAAEAEQILALKDGSIMKVDSYEVRGERVMLTTADGNLFMLPLSRIDFEQSERLNQVLERKRAEQAEAARRRAEQEAAATRAAKLAAQRRQMGLVEASLRYGVEQPGMSVVENRHVPSPTTRPKQTETPKSEPSSPAIKAAEADLERMEERRDTLARRVEELQANTNPNPLLAASRQDMLERYQRQLDEQNSRIERARQRLEALKQREAEKRQKPRDDSDED